ncbi:MAG: hypothetical protein K6C10_06540 [Prevotella sp.]|nr:hypothetical protein [Prevotella sp.]
MDEKNEMKGWPERLGVRSASNDKRVCHRSRLTATCFKETSHPFFHENRGCISANL